MHMHDYDHHVAQTGRCGGCVVSHTNMSDEKWRVRVGKFGDVIGQHSMSMTPGLQAGASIIMCGKSVAKRRRKRALRGVES